jgi:putative transposase
MLIQVRKQLEMTFPSHGGKRRNAGRKPKGARSGVAHRAREVFKPNQPHIVTMRIERDVWSLRRARTYRAIRDAIYRANEAGHVGIIEYSVMGNHLHLIVEAQDESSLSRGMQGLSIRIAKALNKLMGRKGRVFTDRFHSRVLRTGREIRNALAYVLCNARKHGLARNVPRSWVDPLSSAPRFAGWKRRVKARAGPPAPTVGAHSWMLRLGWRRHGLLDPAFVPS